MRKGADRGNAKDVAEMSFLLWVGETEVTHLDERSKKRNAGESEQKAIKSVC
jgi:hypothetical protein